MAAGIFYLNLLLIVEKGLSMIPCHPFRRLCATALQKLKMFQDSIILVAQK